MKIAWMTDIHLDCTGNVYEKLLNLAEAGRDCECFIITGDITVAPFLKSHLQMIEDALQKPFYFVLGNHDYYFSDIMQTRREVVEFSRKLSFSKYLSAIKYVRLSPETALVGHDGWYDALNGNAFGSDVLMNDWVRISDFSSAIRGSAGGRMIDKGVIVQISRSICAASVKHIAEGIKAAVRDKHTNIIVATHVPPFKESYNSIEKHRGMDAAFALPWYTSRTMGDTLMAAANAYPEIKFTILSGHAHSHYDEYLKNNLNVRVGKSAYGSPQIAGYIDT